MDPIKNFLKLFDAFCEATYYSDTTASRLLLGNGLRIDRIRDGAKTSVQVLTQAVERMSELWPEEKDWPQEIWERPKSKTPRNQTDLALVR